VHAHQAGGTQLDQMVMNRWLGQTDEPRNLGQRARPIGHKTQDAQSTLVTEGAGQPHQA
jgi:hypothetical protein